LYNYGIRGVLLKWFESYLTNRKQYVFVNNIKSDFKIIGCGVPQGSILGPLLFLVYMNDLSQASQVLQYILYADDSSLFLSVNDLDRLVTRFNNELQNISQWLYINKLILNVNKTNYMIFTNKHIIIDDIEVKINGNVIQYCNSLTFLGIQIDCKMSWHVHI